MEISLTLPLLLPRGRSPHRRPRHHRRRRQKLLLLQALHALAAHAALPNDGRRRSPAAGFSSPRPAAPPFVQVRGTAEVRRPQRGWLAEADPNAVL